LDRIRAHVLDTPTISISATEIRERVRSGLSIRYLTPEPVVSYIAAHDLYAK
jgi:nicotinate-nucleotide adenylyltransferase